MKDVAISIQDQLFGKPAGSVKDPVLDKAVEILQRNPA
jgi:hypothetical protein